MDGLRTFDGAVAIVTGAASGIGKAIAETLAARGSAVVLTDIYPAGEAPIPGVTVEALEAAVARSGRSVHLVKSLDDVPKAVAALALERRLPTVFGYREHVITGGL